MPQSSSFDVTTGVDMQEVDNAVNQAQKEIAQRYDFKGAAVSIELKRAEEQILLAADSDFRMKALFDVLQTKLIKRGVSVKNLDIGETKPAGGQVAVVLEAEGLVWPSGAARNQDALAGLIIGAWNIDAPIGVSGRKHGPAGI